MTLADLDKNGDGFVDYFTVMHSGYGAESSKVPADDGVSSGGSLAPALLLYILL